MEFIDRIREFAAKVPEVLNELLEQEDIKKHGETEEATKTALVMPFINDVLGYGVFNPKDVRPEFIADIGIKKGEKIDYAIMKDGKPIMFFECKSAKTVLGDAHVSQLFRYFATENVRIGIVTNGIVYHFYSDVDEQNKMDLSPFLVVDLLNFDFRVVTELKKFSKAEFDLEDIRLTARRLKHSREMMQLIENEFRSPSPDFVRYFTDQLQKANKLQRIRLTQSTLEEFTKITQDALQQFIQYQVIHAKVQMSLDTNKSEPTVPAETSNQLPVKDERPSGFTDEERDGYLIVKAILREIVDQKRIFHRDMDSYCGILFEDNNRKPICRLHFNRKQKYIGLFDANKNEERVAINDLDEIYKYADRLKATVTGYLGASASS